MNDFFRFWNNSGFGVFLVYSETLLPDGLETSGVLDVFFVFKKIGYRGIFGPPYCGIGATIRIG